jgi:hypothetical protein
MTATTVDITNTPEDYRAFSRVTRARVGSIRYLPVAAGAIAAVAAIYGLPPLLERYFAPWSDAPLMIGVGVGLVLWCGLVFGLSRLTLRRSFDDDGMYREKKRISLAEDGIHVESAQSRTLIYWPAVKDVVVTKNHVFVMCDRTVGMIVPRRCFAFPADADGFADAVRSHLAKGK